MKNKQSSVKNPTFIFNLCHSYFTEASAGMTFRELFA